MYTLTLIRLSASTLKFENTEVNNIMLLGDIEKALGDHGADFSRVGWVIEMNKGQSIVIHVEDLKNDKMWFYYIHRIV